jgi:2',3'-cyclic-nucleotide 2'-phosphodiesterase (5'-nucleotidase family)
VNPRIFTLIILIQGVKVGFIGYITKNLQSYDSDSIANMTFYDEVESVNTEAKKLKAQGVNIIIAAGHAGKSFLNKCTN